MSACVWMSTLCVFAAKFRLRLLCRVSVVMNAASFIISPVTQKKKQQENCNNHTSGKHMDGSTCGECHGPLQCEGHAKPVVLFPCGHLLHSHCAVYTRKTAKLSSLSHTCPCCGSAIYDAVPLFLSDVAEEKDEKDAAAEDATEEPLDVDAMLTRVFHFQRRNMMHQRAILESKIELKTVQHTLASTHQAKEELERQIGPYAKITTQDTTRVQNVPSTDLLRLIVLTTDDIAQRRKTLERMRTLNGVRARALADAKKALAHATQASTKERPSRQLKSDHLALVSETPQQQAQKRPRDDSIIDVDASSDDDVCSVDEKPSRSSPDVEVVTVVREENDEDELPPLFPTRNATIPQMGVSFNRSLRDLPRSADVLAQRKLR